MVHRAVLLCALLAPAAALLTGAPHGRLQIQPRGALRSQLRPIHALPRAALVTRPVRTTEVKMEVSEGGVALTRLKARLWGVGWLAWWTQIILSTISGVLLLFANRCECCQLHTIASQHA